MLTLRIAFRNIFRQKRRTILTVLTMFGGFTLASISIAWSDGTYSRVINMFTRNRLGHIQVHRQGYLERRSIYKTIDNYMAVGDTIAAVPGVEAWAPRLYAAGLVSIGDKSSATQVIGIDPKLEDNATRFEKKIIEGRSFSFEPGHQTILGQGLAEVLSAKIGDTLVIVSQAADGSIANDAYSVIGIMSSGNKLSDRSSMYLHLRDAQELFVLPDRAHEIVVIAYHLSAVGRLAGEIRTALDNPQLSVETWEQFAHSFYTAMKADQRGSWIMLFIILLVVAVGVLNTVLMTVLERRREYGVMRAIGTAPGEIFRLVTLEVLFMAVIGLIIGFGVAYLVNYLLSINGVYMGQSFTYGGIEFSRMYTEINARSFWIPAISVLLTAVLVSVFPALRAAKTAPARSMRMH
ncbi:MAG: ABC transporter permease [Candidatus Zixiibacteriota bacterium]|jgi:ABC-type lipoprotein release transport system permease subunit